MFDKVRAVVIGAAVTILLALGDYATGIDWLQFGSFGPAIGMVVAALIAYVVKEVRGYGFGVKKEDDGPFGDLDEYHGDDEVDGS
jgi:hypothetical protein